MDKSNFKKQIPNILTIFRIILTPVIITLLLVTNNQIVYNFKIDNHIFMINITSLIAAIFFIIACFSDFLDGYLSRKYQWVSNFGKFWDPIADKILTNSVLFCLSSCGYIPIYFCLIFLIRDIIMEGIRINAISNHIIIPANLWGKIKTIILMVGIVFVLFIHNDNIHFWYYWAVQNLLIMVAIIFAIVSAIIYFINYWKKKNDHKKDI